MADRILKSPLTTIVLVVLVAIFDIHAFARVTENVRADLTQDNLYSLSEGTVAILDKMKQEGGNEKGCRSGCSCLYLVCDECFRS